MSCTVAPLLYYVKKRINFDKNSKNEGQVRSNVLLIQVGLF